MQTGVDTNAGTTQAPDSVREDLASAIESLEGTDGGGDKAGAVQTGTSAPAAPAAATSAADKPLGISKQADPGKSGTAAAPVATEGKQGLTDTPARQSRGPASWKPEVREKWDSLPEEVRGEVLRREREVQGVLQESALTRQFAEAFRRTAEPYGHIIALEGKDPLSVFGEYLKTAAILRSGTAHERANAIAQAVGFYGIDVALLDQALAAHFQGRKLPQGQGGTQQQFADPRVDQLFQLIQQQKDQEEQMLTGEVESELEAFANDPKHEFFEDLRGDISDLLKLAASRGRRMTLADAYDRAAKLHPEISKIVTQREAALAAAKNREAIIGKRDAASSLRIRSPQQTGRESQGSAGTVREDIENAIAMNQGR